MLAFGEQSALQYVALCREYEVKRQQI